MNRRGFFGLLGKLATVGIAMGISPKLLAAPVAEEALYAGGTWGWPGLSISSFDWTFSKKYTKTEIDTQLAEMAKRCNMLSLGEPKFKHYDTGKPDFALAE